MNKRSGKVGVSWHKGHGKWGARLGINYKIIHLGYFDDLEDAIAARVAAEIKYGYHSTLRLTSLGALTQAQLKKELLYYPVEGAFVSLVTRGPRRAGSLAGSLNPDGYRDISIGGKTFGAHRLAFLYMVGWMPVEVDHENHIRDDNRWTNLRPATKTSNQQNVPIQLNNTSGATGVSRDKSRDGWRAYVGFNGKQIFLGRFDKFEDAVAARAAADIKYGYHPNHGKPL